MKIKDTINILVNNIVKIISKWGFTKKGLLKNSKGEWYLFCQVLLILLHLIPPFPDKEYLTYPINICSIVIGITIAIKGLTIALKAFTDLGDNLSPLPYPMKESILITTNSYQDCRHPLYKGLLYISLGICIFTLSLIHLFLFISLGFILKSKALKEEEKLKMKFTEYESYIREVPAIIKNIKILDWRS